MDRKTRKPTQKRSLEKYNSIVEAGFKLFNEKGYYNTTTADIAKEANVATGSVYSYFEDKKDIYIQVLEKINNAFNYPTQDFWIKNNKQSINDHTVFKDIFSEFLKLMIMCHNFSKTFHDDMEALSLLDKDISSVIKQNDINRQEKIFQIFNMLSIPFKSEIHSTIFMHYSDLLTNDVCHKVLYDSAVGDMDFYIDSCSEMLFSLFKANTNYEQDKGSL
jgi:AcrR family transcriptional regulator